MRKTCHFKGQLELAWAHSFPCMRSILWHVLCSEGAPSGSRCCSHCTGVWFQWPSGYPRSPALLEHSVLRPGSPVSSPESQRVFCSARGHTSPSVL